MTTLLKFLFIFFGISFLVALISGGSGVPFGYENFWNHHGLFFLIFITLFPRLTLLLSSVPTGGFLWFLGWLFAPRFLVAILATVNYWNSNKLLVIISWLVCFGGESTEKTYIHKNAKGKFYGKTIDVAYEDRT
jgi:hypothetical protein